MYVALEWKGCPELELYSFVKSMMESYLRLNFDVAEVKYAILEVQDSKAVKFSLIGAPEITVGIINLNEDFTVDKESAHIMQCSLA